MPDTATIIAAILGSNVLVALVTAFFTRKVPPAQAEEYLAKARQVQAEAEELRQKVELADWHRALASIASLREEVVRLKNEVARLEKALRARDKEVAAMEDEIRGLRQQLEEREARILELERTEVEQSEQIVILHRRLEEMEVDLKTYRTGAGLLIEQLRAAGMEPRWLPNGVADGNET